MIFNIADLRRVILVLLAGSTITYLVLYYWSADPVLPWKYVERKTLVEEQFPRLLGLYRQKIKDIKNASLWLSTPHRGRCTNATPPGVPCVDAECNRRLPRMDEERLRRVLTSMHSDDVILLNSMMKWEEFQTHPTGKHILFLTAASSNHFLESQAMVKRLHEDVFPYIRNFTFVYYDLGLTAEEHRQANIHTADIIMWMDSSVQLGIQGFNETLDSVRTQGVALKGGGQSVALNTDIRMMKYFNTTSCLFAPYHMLQATMMIFHNEELVREAIVKPWAVCAVNPNCMCPVNSTIGCRNIRQYGRCHRYDQAAITLLLIQLFGRNVHSLIPSKINCKFRRGQWANYFKDLGLNSSRNVTRREETENDFSF